MKLLTYLSGKIADFTSTRLEKVIWSDADNLALVSDYYPEWLELYLSLETPIHKADFSRNLYMHKVIQSFLENQISTTFLTIFFYNFPSLEEFTMI